MEIPLSALFENVGLIANGKPVLKNIRRITPTRIIDLCDQASEITFYENLINSKSIFSHAASASIGVDRSPCECLECRLNKAYELAQFAALYSDKVYIRNFFNDYRSPSYISNFKKTDLTESLKNDLIIYTALLPLLEAGKVEMVSFGDICPHCLSIRALHENSKIEYEKASKELERRFYKEVTFSLHYEDGEVAISASGPDFLLPHGTLFLVYRNPTDILPQNPKLIEKAKASGEIKLTSNQAKEIKAAAKFSSRITDSVAFELGGANFLNSYYLSDSELEIDFICSLTRDPFARRRTSLMGRYLTCLVPFIDSVNIIDLLTLREREQEAFILFRTALSKAIDEYKTQGKSFTERDAQAVYSDIIQPRLAELDLRIRKAKTSFRKSGYRKLVGWAGAISVGLYTGIFTANPLAGVAAFSAAKLGSEVIEDTMSKSDVTEEIKGDNMFFLWKVKELSKTSSINGPVFN